MPLTEKADGHSSDLAKHMLAHISNSSGFYVGWGTLALINAGIAQSKYRSGLIWFLISLLIGPAATFCLVVFCDDLTDEE